jgi:excisionase family DNA binding protein
MPVRCLPILTRFDVMLSTYCEHPSLKTERIVKPLPRLLTPDEVCQSLRISLRTLQRMSHEGLLRSVKLRGAVRYLEQDVQALLGLIATDDCYCGEPCECHALKLGWTDM